MIESPVADILPAVETPDLRAALARLLRPRSIAIAGASPDPATMGGTLLGNCERFGFDGTIHLISPTRDAIGERPCLKSVMDLPEGVDAVVLNVPRGAIRDAVKGCIARKVGGAVVFASGFGEAGVEGHAEQEAITAMCREHGLALLGPNCLGFTNYADGVALTFEPVEPRSVGVGCNVAVVAQSGAMAASIRGAMHARGMAVSYVVSIGNEAVVRSDDLIDLIVAQGGATTIALYAEQIRAPQRFLAAARRARAAGVPIVMLHPGRSERGRQAAQSHTGSMVGDYAVMRTAVTNESVALVDSLDELVDVIAILQSHPAPPPGDLAIITNSGAIRGMSFDCSDAIGLPLARLAGDTERALREALAAPLEIDNPLDVGTTGFVDGGVFGRTTAAMLADRGVGAVLLSMAGGAPVQQRAKAEAILPLARVADKPVALAIVGDESPLDPDFVASVRAAGTPLFRSPERAMRAFASVRAYADSLSAISDRAPSPSAVPAVGASGTLTEHAGKRFLASLGIPVPRGRLVTTVDEAAAVAASIGYPVVLKAQAVTLTHKSDIGGVVVGLDDEEGTRAGWRRLMDNLTTASVVDAIDGVLVERMAAPGLEMVVGARHHPEWGATVLVGLGGVWVEALDAVELLPADISHARAVERIRALRGARLLGAFRGRPPRDVDAVADAVIKIGAAMRAGLGIAEIDVNPLVVHAEGEGAVALDALIVVEQ